MAYSYLGDPKFKYGNTARYYGQPATARTGYIWSIEIDWNKDGTYEGSNEALYCKMLETDRGFSDVFDTNQQGEGWGFAPPFGGSAFMVLDNSSGRYNTWSALGAPTTDISPGSYARIRVRDGQSSTDRDVFTGYVKDITNNRETKEVSISLGDGIEWLKNKEANVALTLNADAQTAMGFVLADVSYPWTYAQLYANTTIPYFWSNKNVLPVLNEINKIDDAVFFVEEDGSFTRESLNGLFSTDTNLTTYESDVFLKRVTVSEPWDNLYTQLKYVNRYYDVSTDVTIWDQGDGQISLAGSTSIERFVEYQKGTQSDKNFFAIATAPVATSDYVAYSDSDGTSDNLTSDISISLSDFGRSGKLTITNNNAAPAYFTLLQVRGDTYSERISSRKVSITDFLAIGTKTFAVESEYLQGGMSVAVFDNLGYPHIAKRVQVQIETKSEQFERKLNDAVQFNITNPYIAPIAWRTEAGKTTNYNQFKIMRIRHRWMNENGQKVMTTWDARHALLESAPTEL